MRMPAAAFRILFLTCGLTCLAEAPKIPSIALTDRKVVTVRAGQPVNLTLLVQLGTGFSWTLNRVPANVLLIQKYVQSGAANLPGGTETQIFRIALKTRAETPLLFEMRRFGSPSQKAIQAIRVTLQVDQ